MNARWFFHKAPILTRRVLVSAARRSSMRGANSDVAESNKKGAKRVKSPKSKSPAPAVPQSAPLSAPENEDLSETVVQLKGHDAEVCDHMTFKAGY